MSFIQKRLLSQTKLLRSHVGSLPLYTSPEVQVSMSTLSIPRIIRKGRASLNISQNITVEGPKGKLSIEVPDFLQLDRDEKHGKINVVIQNAEDKYQRSMWGTVRSLINNHIIGVTEGHLAVLRFVGTGYRAQLENDGRFVNIKVGASIKQGLDVPENIVVKSPAPTSLIIEGCDKQQVLLFAAKLRKFHPPEPYKGKGIYVNGETIKLKDKKIK
ncbi:mitochondrial 54S ribosomal protein uL6m [Saccharomyces eubayanus]|uniref:mitochondrial 54S ribosomal protein uL6m n=1 Tax=Saccharomyces eubayanus TaxID=1080349 RepID=UPI0006BF3D39|nr:MRPL6-like protein [Saccharomyces eubayanus]KOG99207.1 MRPL6-like protein [Saccharomyces eubayanus]